MSRRPLARTTTSTAVRLAALARESVAVNWRCPACGASCAQSVSAARADSMRSACDACGASVVLTFATHVTTTAQPAASGGRAPQDGG